MKRTILCILIVLTLGVISTLSIYQYSNQELKKDNKVNDVTESSTLALFLVEGYDEEETETELTGFPDASTHYLDFAKSYCVNGTAIGWDTTNNKVKITSDNADSCKLYFRAGTAVNPKSDILARNTLVTTAPDFSAIATDSNNNIYQAEDDYGISYYFRGAPVNNYVQLGEWSENAEFEVSYWDSELEDSDFKNVEVKAGDLMYWRIVRINGDGSIRLIYAGTEKVANGVEHTAAIASTVYNENIDDENHIGYTYNTSKTDFTQIDSEVKGVVDAWYDTHLESTYGSYIADSIFCNDRQVARYEYCDLNDCYGNSEDVDSSSEEKWVNKYYRLYENNTPVLKCTNKSDRYTVKDKINGNGYLTNPVGLLTADEALMAGGIRNNHAYYLYSGGYYWTSTPDSFEDAGFMYYYAHHGVAAEPLDSDYVGARPVINIRADVLFTGNGSIETPYKIAGFE